MLWYLRLFVCFFLSFKSVWSIPINCVREHSPMPSMRCVQLNPRLGLAFVFLSGSHSIHCERGLCVVSNFLVCKTLPLNSVCQTGLGRPPPGRVAGGEAWLRELLSEEMFGCLPTTSFQHPEGQLLCCLSNCSKASYLTSQKSRMLFPPPPQKILFSSPV